MRVYTKNMCYRNRREKDLAGDILQVSADAVMLQEVNGDNRKIFDMLAGTYPYKMASEFAGIGKVAILSKHPIITREKSIGLVMIKIKADGKEVWVGSLHMETPIQNMKFHKRQAKIVAEKLAALKGPMVIAGDFNNVLGSKALKTIMGSRLNYIGKRLKTYRKFWFFWFSLDHVLATGRGTNRRRSWLGSDHKGVVAEIDLEA